MEAPAATASGGRTTRARQGRLTTIVIMAVTAAVIGAVAFVVEPARRHADGRDRRSASPATASGAAPEVGKAAPDFAGPDGRRQDRQAQRLQGQARLADLRGQLVPALPGREPGHPGRPSQKHAGSDLVVLEVFISEDAAAVKDYADRVGLTYQKIADPGTKIASQYRILGIPSHFFIDKRRDPPPDEDRQPRPRRDGRGPPGDLGMTDGRRDAPIAPSRRGGRCRRPRRATRGRGRGGARGRRPRRRRRRRGDRRVRRPARRPARRIPHPPLRSKRGLFIVILLVAGFGSVDRPSAAWWPSAGRRPPTSAAAATRWTPSSRPTRCRPTARSPAPSATSSPGARAGSRRRSTAPGSSSSS